jgi:hypothetical protein
MTRAGGKRKTESQSNTGTVHSIPCASVSKSLARAEQDEAYIRRCTWEAGPRGGSYAVHGAGAMVLVNVMQIPCFGRRMTIGRASIIWPGAN